MSQNNRAGPAGTPEPNAIVFLTQHVLAGGAGALAVCAGLLAFDVSGIATLISTTEGGWLGLLMLFFGLCVTFGSVAMGVAIMGLRDGSDAGQPGRSHLPE